LIQVVHLSGEPGNVREFISGHVNVRELTKSREIVKEKCCIALGFVSPVFAAY